MGTEALSGGPRAKVVTLAVKEQFFDPQLH